MPLYILRITKLSGSGHDETFSIYYKRDRKRAEKGRKKRVSLFSHWRWASGFTYVQWMQIEMQRARQPDKADRALGRTKRTKRKKRNGVERERDFYYNNLRRPRDVQPKTRPALLFFSLCTGYLYLSSCAQSQWLSGMHFIFSRHKIANSDFYILTIAWEKKILIFRLFSDISYAWRCYS